MKKPLWILLALILLAPWAVLAVLYIVYMAQGPKSRKRDAAAECVTFSPDGRRVLAGHRDGQVRVWDVETGKELSRFGDARGVVDCAAFFPDGRRAV